MIRVSGNLPLLFVLSAVLLAWSAASARAEYEYRLTGVARDDTLNVREFPEGAESIKAVKVVGTLPWNAIGVLGTGVTVRVGTARWHEIRWHGVRGWVNGRFLRPGRPENPAIWFRALNCGGTEPFWKLRVRGSEARYESLSEPSAAYSIRLHRGRNRTNLWSLTLKPRNAAAPATAVVVRSGKCSDGMSERDYPFDLYLAPTGKGPLQGCCSIAR